MCYGVTIGTIDEKGTGSLHGPCAVIFFVVWMVVIMRITTFLRELREYDSSVLTRRSMVIKNLLAIYILGVWLYCIYGLIMPEEDLTEE
jgi:hypothetical protein